MHTESGSESPLLSVAIPTYNRARFLDRLLSALDDQLRSQPGVELIVSDNASPDETPQIVSKFQSQGLRIRYLRNDSNLGADGNILQCYEQAKGKYVWIFGDDDVREPGSIAQVLSHLQGQEYDLIYVASSAFTESYTPRQLNGSRGFTVINRADSLACHVNIFFTFISGNIVNKERVSSLDHRPFAELVGTNLVQLGWIYTALDHHRRSLLLHDPLVATLTDNTGGYALFRVFGPNLQRITDGWLRSPRTRRPILNGALQRFFPPFLLSQKASRGTFVGEDPRTTLEPVFGGNFRYWVFDYPILRMPRQMGRVWILFLRVVNRLDRLLGSPLLRF